MKKRMFLAVILTWALAACALFGQYHYKSGSTNVSVYFDVMDANGDPNTSIAVTDIKVCYVIGGSAASAQVSLTALAAANSAHTDNYGYNVGYGQLRVDFPDAAFAGAAGTIVKLIATDQTGATDDGQKDKIPSIKIQIEPPVNLTSWDSNDLTHDAWDTTYHVPIVNTGYIVDGQAASMDDVNDAIVDNTADIKAVTDHVATAIELDGAVYRFTTNSLELAPTAAAAATIGWQLSTTVAAGTNTTKTFRLTAGPTANGWFGVRKWTAIIIDADNSMPDASPIVGYTGATKLVTLLTELSFTPAAADVVYLIPSASTGSGGGGWIGQ